MKSRMALIALTASLAAVPAAQAATVSEKYTTVTRVNGSDPAACNKLGVLKMGPSTAKNVLVLIPGFLGGSGDFRVIGKRLVPALKNKVQVWGIDRRSQCLEDTTGFGPADPVNALGYYIFGNSVGGKKFTAPKLGDAGVEAARNWGLSTTLNDIRAVVLSAKSGGRKVVLGGHSLGGSLTSIYATWDFDGTPGYRDVSGLVLIDGAARGTFGAQPDPATVASQIAAVTDTTKLPFSSLISGIPTYYNGVFPELAARYAKFAPGSNAALQGLLNGFGLGAFTRPTSEGRLTNDSQLGYSFDRDTAPSFVSLLHMNMGSLKAPATSGAASGWQDGGLTDLKDVKTLFGTEPGNFVEWYFPSRLSIEVGAATNLTKNALTDSLSLRPWHRAAVNVPLYGFETGLTCSNAVLGEGNGRPSPSSPSFASWIAANRTTSCSVLTGTKSLQTGSSIPLSKTTLVADHDQEHLDPLVARASSNKFQSTVTPFLKARFAIR
ncbi:MAG: alpha/beta fold hydrolase [Actinomycetes bacterium]